MKSHFACSKQFIVGLTSHLWRAKQSRGALSVCVAHDRLFRPQVAPGDDPNGGTSMILPIYNSSFPDRAFFRTLSIRTVTSGAPATMPLIRRQRKGVPAFFSRSGQYFLFSPYSSARFH